MSLYTASPAPSPSPWPSNAPQPEPSPQNAIGIKPWWTFQVDKIPGVGPYAVNVGTGNMVVAKSDIVISGRGLPLNFTRVYNSKSNHDAANDDGSGLNVFGDGWTNTYDQRLVEKNLGSSPTMWVYDATGARFGYNYNSNTGTWTPPAGLQATSLTYDGTKNPCTYIWTLRDGSKEIFYSPQWDTCSGTGQTALNGRLWRIAGRNNLNGVALVYSFSSAGPTSLQNLTEIDVNQWDGDTLKLTFGLVGANNQYNELVSLATPSGDVITYTYFASDLHAVLWGKDTDEYEHYEYTNGVMSTADSPNDRHGAIGDEIDFTYDKSNNLIEAAHWGANGFEPTDYTGSAPGPVGNYNWRLETFSGWSSSVIQYTDADGHASNWTIDGSSRVAQTQVWDGSFWLTTNQGWDDYDNTNKIAYFYDVNNNRYDAEYDPASGNLVALAMPIPSSDFAYRPTKLFTYDSYNNLVAYCDPVEAHTLGADWTGSTGPGIGVCKKIQGATVQTWDFSDTHEPYGRLSNVTDPKGTGTVTYSNFDTYGEPQTITGVMDTQLHGPSSITPTKTLIYDGYGDVISENNGIGTASATYNAYHRISSFTDADGVRTRYYYSDYYDFAHLACVQSALQYYKNGNQACSNTNSLSGTYFNYDFDGNVEMKSTVINSIIARTSYDYDGFDRLVEVQEPTDPTDLYQNNGQPTWLTRYFYGVTGMSQVTLSDGTNSYSYYPYGEMYKVQRYVPPAGQTTGLQWQDVSGRSFDSLNRVVRNFVLQPAGLFHSQVFSYDTQNSTAQNYLGQLSTYSPASGGSVSYTYDALGSKSTKSFDVVGNESFHYDADGRLVSYTDANVGASTLKYDADGHMVQYIEPGDGNGNPWANQNHNLTQSLGTITSESTYNYSYDNNGLLDSLTVSGAALQRQSNGNYFREYDYRADGSLVYEASTYNHATQAFTRSLSSAGRVSEADPVSWTVAV